MGAAMEVMVMADPMEDMEAMAMARGRLRPPLMLSLAMDTEAMADVMADPMEDMEAMAMARERLRLLLMLSMVMDKEAMADLMAAMEVMVMADPMEDMEAMAMESKPQTELKPLFFKQAFMF